MSKGNEHELLEPRVLLSGNGWLSLTAKYTREVSTVLAGFGRDVVKVPNIDLGI